MSPQEKAFFYNWKAIIIVARQHNRLIKRSKKIKKLWNLLRSYSFTIERFMSTVDVVNIYRFPHWFNIQCSNKSNTILSTVFRFSDKSSFLSKFCVKKYRDITRTANNSCDHWYYLNFKCKEIMNEMRKHNNDCNMHSYILIHSRARQW